MLLPCLCREWRETRLENQRSLDILLHCLCEKVLQKDIEYYKSALKKLKSNKNVKYYLILYLFDIFKILCKYVQQVMKISVSYGFILMITVNLDT